MPTLLALINLVTIDIFSVATGVCFVVEFQVANLIQFCHEDSSPFWEYFVCGKTIVPEGAGFQLSFNFTERYL